MLKKKKKKRPKIHISEVFSLNTVYVCEDVRESVSLSSMLAFSCYRSHLRFGWWHHSVGWTLVASQMNHVCLLLLLFIFSKDLSNVEQTNHSSQLCHDRNNKVLSQPKICKCFVTGSVDWVGGVFGSQMILFNYSVIHATTSCQSFRINKN